MGRPGGEGEMRTEALTARSTRGGEPRGPRQNDAQRRPRIGSDTWEVPSWWGTLATSFQEQREACEADMRMHPLREVGCSRDPTRGVGVGGYQGIVTDPAATWERSLSPSWKITKGQGAHSLLGQESHFFF